ncbi:MAG: sulfite exporter TauE/SafE family protein [Burkholderiales bacterium]|nr:sulfite exporter TauE/SafE family protein [Burkholderiales bacterium]
MEWWPAYLGVGAVVGVLAGMLGIGGGAIMVPLVAQLLLAQGIAKDQVLHLAVGTAMATILFTSVSSVRAHARRGALRWDIVKRITPGILAGGLAGSLFASLISTRSLAVFFAALVAALAFNMLLDVKPKPTRQLPGPAGMFAAGAAIGALSALAAIGGAAMTVPFMVMSNVPAIQAVGTAAAIGFPIAAAGTVGYVATGLAEGGLPAGSIGYVYLPALVGISVASMLTAPLGARLAHALPTKRLKQLFAVFLLFLAARLVWKMWS